jgi:hypothetical protein
LGGALASRAHTTHLAEMAADEEKAVWTGAHYRVLAVLCACAHASASRAQRVCV